MKTKTIIILILIGLILALIYYNRNKTGNEQQIKDFQNCITQCEVDQMNGLQSLDTDCNQMCNQKMFENDPYYL